MIKLVGIDASTTSTGCVKFTIDENYNIVKKEILGFTEVSKKSKETYESIITYIEEDYPTFYHKQQFMISHIVNFSQDADYVAFEDFAFNAMGNITMLAEFCGNIKSRLFEKNINLRFYDPQSIKLFAGKGNAKKPDMFDYFEAHPNKLDLSYLPQIPVHKKGKNAGERNKDGVSPLSDIVDAFFITSLLLEEIKAKNGLEVGEIGNKILTRTTKNTKISIKDQRFISADYQK